MAASYNEIPLPSSGTKITYENGKLVIPDNPIIPFIEGDGTGRDIWKASVRVFDAAVEIAYNGKRRVAWYEVFAGEKAMDRFKTWLPDDTVAAFRELAHRHQGPTDHPGWRRHPFAERRVAPDPRPLCLRSSGEVYQGIPSPVKHPERMNIVIYRENTEDVYAGIEWKQGTPRGQEADRLPQQQDAGGHQETGPRGLRHRHQAHLHHRHQAPGAHGHPVRAGQQTQIGDHRPQGQHPEVHRRRVPRVGLRAGHPGVPRPGHHRARELDPRQPRQESRTDHRRQRQDGRARSGICAAGLPRRRSTRK